MDYYGQLGKGFTGELPSPEGALSPNDGRSPSLLPTEIAFSPEGVREDMGQSLVKNYIHIVFSTKYREPLIHPPYEKELHSYL
ncbi:MAG: hypothetical protein KAU17_09730, partial [Spirochaetales bacterium]|nr:hypothetical protein [Spirochaetales bacterium]